MKKKSHVRPIYIMEAERNRVQGNRVISLWKVRTRTRHGHGCLVKHIASRWDANKYSFNSVIILKNGILIVIRPHVC